MFAVFNRFDRRYEEAARDLGATPWQTIRHVVAADPAAQPDRRRPVRLHAVLRRVRAQPLHGRHLQHPAARDLRHDHQRHDAGALCARHGDDRRLLPRDRAGAAVGDHGCAAAASAMAATPARPPDMARRAKVLRLPTAGPQDTAPLAAAIDRGEIDPATIVAIVGKTEGNGCVNDFTRGYATLALKLLLAERAGLPAGRDREAGRHRHVGRHRGRAVAASAGLLPRGDAVAPCRRTAARHRRRPDARLQARGDRPGGADRGDRRRGDARHEGRRHRLAGRRPFRADQMPAADQGAHRGGGTARRHDGDRRHLPFDGPVARRLGARRRAGAGRDRGRARRRRSARTGRSIPASPAPRPASSCCATRSSCWATRRTGPATW